MSYSGGNIVVTNIWFLLILFLLLIQNGSTQSHNSELRNKLMVKTSIRIDRIQYVRTYSLLISIIPMIQDLIIVKTKLRFSPHMYVLASKASRKMVLKVLNLTLFLSKPTKFEAHIQLSRSVLYSSSIYVLWQKRSQI